MRKIVGLLICLAVILFVAYAEAAPVGNIATPAVLKKGLVIQNEKGDYGIVAGPEIDVTFDRNLKSQDGDSEAQFYCGKVGILLMDKFIAYSVLGAAKAEQKFKISNNKVKWDTDTNFTWAIGGTVMLWEKAVATPWNGTLRVGVDGRYRQAHLDVDKIKLNDTEYKSTNASVTSTHYEFEEWQAALGVSYQVEKLIPYVGVKFSDATGDASTTISGTTYKIDFDNKDNFGIFAGIDFLAADWGTLNVEGRLIDETALTAGATLRF
jgi:hypothetical protein